ncbi:Hypothetical protein NGAL_HAMBI2566_29690 [Neorhizobium galegae bv. orientalis]|nr:Hypothetical protein NGAL_HAMBI2566_29690 [Neorhizobium galegae bv. orientalis]CDZ73440.1 Hypothetical protein NGAL_HAMBI2610_50720 [Neorhizobium galegae bv. orientalis]
MLDSVVETEFRRTTMALSGEFSEPAKQPDDP